MGSRLGKSTRAPTATGTTRGTKPWFFCARRPPRRGLTLASPAIPCHRPGAGPEIETTASVTAPRLTADARIEDARPGYGFDGPDFDANPGTWTTPRIVAASDDAAATNARAMNDARVRPRMARNESPSMVWGPERPPLDPPIGLPAQG